MDERQSEIDDDFLIEAARGGDDIAFGRLVERYKDVVYATAVAITRDFDGAHDIAQEVFLRAWLGLGGLREAAALPGWLRTIARNRAKTWLERRHHQPLQENVDLAQIADRADSPEDQAEKAERRRLVLSALDKLSEGSREVLVLHYIEGLATPRIATQLDLTEEAVRQRLRRARQQMREEVEDMVADVLRDEAPGADFSAAVGALIERSKGLFQQVRYRAAAPVLESARDQAPTDTLVSLLLADAYTFMRGPEDLEQDRGAYDRALALLDEVLEHEPDNTLAQLRRAAVRATLAPEEDIFTEQKKILKKARGGPFEAVAELELARRHLSRGQAEPALAFYGELLKKYEWLACILHSELGVTYVMVEQGAKAAEQFELAAAQGARAIEHFEQAVQLTTPKAMEALQETSERLMGAAYWAFWSTVDNLPVRQCQNHAWLAGLRMVRGDEEQARQHLRQSVQYLKSDGVGAAGAILKREFVNQMEQMFPQVAAQAEVQALRQELEEG